MEGALNPIADEGTVDLLGNGFNNDWKLKKLSPVGDLSLSANANRYWLTGGGDRFALMAAINYSNSYKTYRDMTNSLFGAYDETNNRSNYLRRSIDNQYNHSVRLGAMATLTFVPTRGNSKSEWKNIFTQLGRSRYTSRTGLHAPSNLEDRAQYYYIGSASFRDRV